MLHDIVLWLFVIFGGIAVGAGLYEMRVNVPRWFTPAGGSSASVNVEAITTDDAGRRFWAYVTTGPLTLLTVAVGSTAVGELLRRGQPRGGCRGHMRRLCGRERRY